MTDLDGTFLNNNHQISQKSIQVIEEFQRNGGIFTIATGRIQTSITRFIDQLNIEHPVITHNGAQVYCPETDQVIYRETFTMTESLKATLRSLEDVEVVYFINESIYTERKGPITRAFERNERMTALEQAPPAEAKEISKIMITHENNLLLQAIEQQIKEENHPVATTFSEPEYLELLPTRASKGNALNYLKEHYIGLDRQVITFGNNLNDITLLTEADIGLAVNNAHPDLKYYSTAVLEKTNQEDAVADYIESLQLIKQFA